VSNGSAQLAATRSTRIYVALALLITVIALVGFWPTYFGRVLSGANQAPAIIHFHAAVFVCWLALFIAQVTFVATGRIALHIRCGRWIIGYGVFLIVVGLVTAFDRFGTEVVNGHQALAQRKLYAPLRDILFFAPFLYFGWRHRKKPALHKRLMIVATTILLVAAVSRMRFLGPAPVPLRPMMLVWGLPIYIALIYDMITERRIYAVYVIGWVAMLAMWTSIPLRDTQPWLKATAWLAGLYT
jgi:hypothetical protein